MSQKEAQTTHNIHELIKKRWSPRAFANNEPSREILLTLFEAAQWAPSSFNEQPWAFLVGCKDSAAYRQIYDTLAPFNQGWAVKAPVLAVACAKRNFSHNDQINRHYMYDTGAAMAYLALEATHQGLYVHQMAGFDVDKITDSFEIPDTYEALTVVAIGYIGNAQELSDKYKESELNERSRKPLADILYAETWGKAF